MQDHALRVGEEVVIEGRIRLTILAVEGDRVFFGIAAAEPHRRQRPGGPPAATPDGGCAGASGERQLTEG